jgi:hypothetical protein
LGRSNEELKEFLKEDPGDADFLEAVADNLKTIQRKEARKAELELEALEKGIDLNDFESKAKPEAVVPVDAEEAILSMDEMAAGTSMEDEMCSMDSQVQQTDAERAAAAVASDTPNAVAELGGGVEAMVIDAPQEGGAAADAGLYL